MATLAFPIGNTGYTEAEAVQLVSLALQDTDVVASLSVGVAGAGTRCVTVSSSDTAPGLVAADVTTVTTSGGWTDVQLPELLAALPESAGLVTANEKVFILTGVTPEQVNAANSALEATASTKGYVASIDRSQYQGEEYASTSARIIGSFDARGMRDIVGNGPEGAQLRRTDPLSGRSYDDIANPGNNQFGANESLGRGRFAPFLEDGYTVNLDGVDSKNRGDEVTAAVCQRLRRLRSANGVVHAGLWSYSGRASRAGGRGWHGSLLIDGQEIAVIDEIALNEEAEKLFAANGMYTGKFYELARNDTAAAQF